MSMFPGAGAQIYKNEEGEVTGWDYPSTNPMDNYCDMCGFSHSGDCPDDYEEEEEPIFTCCGEDFFASEYRGISYIECTGCGDCYNPFGQKLSHPLGRGVDYAGEEP